MFYKPLKYEKTRKVVASYLLSLVFYFKKKNVSGQHKKTGVNTVAFLFFNRVHNRSVVLYFELFVNDFKKSMLILIFFFYKRKNCVFKTVTKLVQPN
jgi:hypothetical protein